MRGSSIKRSLGEENQGIHVGMRHARSRSTHRASAARHEAGWPAPGDCITTRTAWRTWSPSPYPRPLTSGGAGRALRRDGAT